MSILPFGVDNSENEARLEDLESRVSTLETSGPGGGLPEGTTLDEIDDGESRFALSTADKQRLDNYAANDGKTGDEHAVRTDNPHAVTAAQVGAPTTEDFGTLSAAVDTATGDIADLGDRMDAVESTNSSQASAISDLQTDVENLSGGNPGFRWVPLRMIVNSTTLTDAPSATTEWSGAMRAKHDFATAQKMRASARVSASGASGSVARPIYSTNGFSSFTEITGMDLSVSSVAANGIYSSEIDIPSGLASAGEVLISVACNGGDSTADPTLVGYVIEVFDSAVITGAFELPIGLEDTEDDTSGTGRLAMTNAERTKLSGIEAGAEVNDVTSVHGRTGAVVAASGDYTTAIVADSTDKRYVTDAEKTAIGSAKLPADTINELAGKASSADGITSTERTKVGNLPTDTNAALALKAPLDSPTFTTAANAPTPSTGDNSTKIATTAFVKNQAYLTSVTSHTHGTSDVVGTTEGTLSDTIAALRADISALSGGADATYGVMSITSTATNNAPILDKDVVFIEHTIDATVTITATLSKKPHTLVFLGNPKQITVIGATGAGQSIKGSTGNGLSFVSGTDAAATTRTLVPDPDVAFPNRWRIF